MPMPLRRRRLGACLGLLAFALIALAPLVSQWRAEHQDWSWLAELACHDGHAQAPSSPSPAPAAAHLDACGYCSLLVHSPALGNSDWSGFTLGAPSAAPVALAARRCPLERRFPDTQSRAPPALG